MNEKLSLENILQGYSKRLGLNEIFANTELLKDLSVLNVRCYRRLTFSLKQNLFPTIAIVTPQAINQLCSKEINSFCPIFENIIFILVARSQGVPDVIKIIAKDQNIPIAASDFDEYYIETSLKRLIREKVEKKSAIHGVAIETYEKGIIITGASGIGKTTSALKYVRNKGYWIADDLAIVSNNIKGELIVRGHPKIKKYVHYGKEGIIPVKKVLPAGKLKKETKLSAIIEVKRTDFKGNAFRVTKKEFLGTTLSFVNISLSKAGYFSENLLEKIVRKLDKGGQ